MQIQFDSESGETFQNVLTDRLGGYTVEITPLEGEKYDLPFDAVIVGPGDDWYDAVVVRAYNEDIGEAEGEPFSIRVASVKVY